MDGSATANMVLVVVVVAPAMEADVVITTAVQRDRTVPKPGYSTLLRCPSLLHGPTFLCFLAWTAVVVVLERQEGIMLLDAEMGATTAKPTVEEGIRSSANKVPACKSAIAAIPQHNG